VPTSNGAESNPRYRQLSPFPVAVLDLCSVVCEVPLCRQTADGAAGLESQICGIKQSRDPSAFQPLGSGTLRPKPHLQLGVSQPVPPRPPRTTGHAWPHRRPWSSAAFDSVPLRGAGEQNRYSTRAPSRVSVHGIPWRSMVAIASPASLVARSSIRMNASSVNTSRGWLGLPPSTGRCRPECRRCHPHPRCRRASRRSVRGCGQPNRPACRRLRSGCPRRRPCPTSPCLVPVPRQPRSPLARPAGCGTRRCCRGSNRRRPGPPVDR
jgi:hypothetical protein